MQPSVFARYWRHPSYEIKPPRIFEPEPSTMPPPKRQRHRYFLTEEQHIPYENAHLQEHDPPQQESGYSDHAPPQESFHSDHTPPQESFHSEFAPPPREPTPDVDGIMSGAIENKLKTFSSLQDFLETQQKKQDQLARNENQLEIQSRLSKSKNAERFICPGPKSRTKVYILWEKSNGKLSWGRIYRNFFEDCWDVFTNNQKRYDAYQDAWTMSKLFAPGEVPEDDGENDDDYLGPNYISLRPLSQPPESYPSVPLMTGADNIISSGIKAIDEDISYMYPGGIELKRRQIPDDLETILSVRYAYAFDPDKPMVASENENVFQELTKISGFLGGFPLVADENQVQGSPYYRQMLLFLRSLMKSYAENEPKSYEQFQTPFQSSNGRIKVEIFYASKDEDRYLYSIIPVENSSDVTWTLVVTNLLTALEIVRRDWSASIREIARQLIHRGIPFHTLITAQRARELFQIEDDGEIPESPTPTIWSNAAQILKRADLASYQARIKDILCTPHGRKALLMGGIVWRWAVEYLNPEDALQGPSSECLKTQPVCSNNGVEYYDDALSPCEINVVLGSHRVFTGKKYTLISMSA